ncbi:MAG: HAD family hydrolase [Chloroflexota bacterium]
MTRRFDLVLFDLGDTLLYFDGSWAEVMAEGRRELLRSLQAAGLPVGQDFLDDFYRDLKAYYREREAEFVEYTVGYVLRACLARWGYADLPEAVARRALQDMHTITQAHWIPEDDALPTLQRLQALNYRLGLISNAADDPNTQVLVDKGGFRPYFELIVSSAAQGIRKPNPQIFHTALQALGAPPQRAVMVGDTLGADILGARNAGIFSIWITRRANRPANAAHADTIHPDAVIGRLAELPDLLERLCE